ncbi:hypothetical protein [Croceicoccus naphthovorans]|uniref:hypothetical protein n=1 Tax=Croceicoccus naphthovorans TaxID=1348774 RepID=UPI00069E2D8F|nr:hypothetical protein [Croceicoccus naphthovorans]MBB3990481.1 hypothetical protein [Croceicoccus naphthovorans]
MYRTLAAAAALSLLGACGTSEAPAPAPTDTATVAPTPTPTPTFDAKLPNETVADPQALLDYWKQAVEAGEREAARRAWRKEVRAGGMAPRWEVLANPVVTFGEGRQEGAAGSLYYEVPVTVMGSNADGAGQSLTGKMVLRRVNGVDGATPEQLSWRIERIEWEG